ETSVPSLRHSRTVLSLDAEASVLPSGDHTVPLRKSPPLCSVATGVPLRQVSRVRSAEAEASVLPSGSHARPDTLPVLPPRVASASPDALHTRTDLSA